MYGSIIFILHILIFIAEIWIVICSGISDMHGDWFALHGHRVCVCGGGEGGCGVGVCVAGVRVGVVGGGGGGGGLKTRMSS